MTHVLFVNHRTRECGVNQLGKRYYDAFRESKRYIVDYIDVDERHEFEYWFNELRPSAVIWNFYSGQTMYWLANEVIENHRAEAKQIGIYHELDLSSKGFDLLLHQNPITTDNFPHWKLPRSIPEYNTIFIPPEITTFGSFGFGLAGKGFDTLVERVNKEYDRALVRLHISYAAFGDPTGSGAQWWIDESRKRITKPGIELEVTTDFWPEEQLLDWLAHNTCNAFFYGANHGRGIASTLDYAIAADRPLAITRSEQFRHIWSIDDSFLVENQTLQQIIDRGSAPLEQFRRMWSREALIDSFEQALMSLGVMP